MKKITVILPIYNVKEYIDEAMDSLIKQTIGFNNIEVIMVDDGSDDGSAEIINKYKNKYNNVKAIHLEGPSGAAGKPRNVGLEKATTEFVMFLDPDDVYLEDTCENLYNTIIEDKCDLVIGKSQRLTTVGVSDIPLIDSKLKVKNTNVKIEELPSLLQEFIHLNSILFNREFIKKNQLSFMEKRATQDALFTEMALLKSDRISFIPDVVYYYRMRESKENLSITQGKKVKYFDDLVYMSKISKGLYDNHSLNYFEARFPSILGWTLLQIEGAGELDINEKYKILEIVKPFIELTKETDISYVSEDKQKLVKLILENNFKEVINLMKQPVSEINLR